MQVTAHGLGAGREQEPTAEPLADALDAESGMLLLQGDDLLVNGRGQLGLGLVARRRLEPGFTAQPVSAHPVFHTALADAGLLADDREAESLLEVEPDNPEFFGRGIAPIFWRALPPRGDERMSPLLLDYCFFIHVNTSFIIEVSTTFSLKSVS